MKTNITLFAQIIKSLDRPLYNNLVYKYETDKHCKGFNSWSHLLTMLFCQFSNMNSLRDITNGLQSLQGDLNHLGIQKSPKRSTLSYQNEHRDWRLFQAFYYEMLERLTSIAQFKQVKFKIKSKIYLLDSTTISL